MLVLILATQVLSATVVKDKVSTCARELAAELTEMHAAARERSLRERRDSTFALDGSRLIVDHVREGRVGANQIERALREIESTVHLLAAPTEMLGSPRVRAVHPRTLEPASHWLFISASGPAALLEHRRRFGIVDEKENLVNLTEVGIVQRREFEQGNPGAIGFAEAINSELTQIPPRILKEQAGEVATMILERVVDFLVKNTDVLFEELDQELRRSRSPCYLLALHQRFIQVPGRIIEIPNRPRTDTPYALQVMIADPSGAAAAFRSLGTTLEENSERVKDVGLFQPF